jgi:hypothetical protein
MISELVVIISVCKKFKIANAIFRWKLEWAIVLMSLIAQELAILRYPL